MKLTVLIPILALLVGVADAAISCQQQLDRYEVRVGESFTVMVYIANPGISDLEISDMTPQLPPGLTPTYMDLMISGNIPPGETRQASYSVRADQSGSFDVQTLISYVDENGPGQVTLYGDYPVTVNPSPSNQSMLNRSNRP